MNVYARVSNGVVREVIYFDPQGDFTPNLTWVQVSNSITTGANISGDTYAIQPRWSYDGMMFNPPLPPIPQPRPTGHATYVDHFAFVGQGENVWVEIGNVNIISNLNIAHFLSYSLDVYDSNLVPYSTQIYLPNGNTTGGGGYGGSELAGINGGAAQASGVGGTGNGLDAVAAALDAAAAAATASNVSQATINGSLADTISMANIGGTDPEPATGGNGCFTQDTRISMIDGSTKFIKDIQIGDTLLGDSGPVNVLNKWVGIGNYALVDFNKKGYFITSNHPVLTDQGWGAVDVMLFAATEPENYQRVLQNNNFQPLVDVKIGSQLAVWINGNVAYETLATMDMRPPIEIEVYNLNVTGDDHYIANGYIVHNK